MLWISSDTCCVAFHWTPSISFGARSLQVFVTLGRMSSQPHNVHLRQDDTSLWPFHSPRLSVKKRTHWIVQLPLLGLTRIHRGAWPGLNSHLTPNVMQEWCRFASLVPDFGPHEDHRSQQVPQYMPSPTYNSFRHTVIRCHRVKQLHLFMLSTAFNTILGQGHFINSKLQVNTFAFLFPLSCTGAIFSPTCSPTMCRTVSWGLMLCLHAAFDDKLAREIFSIGPVNDPGFHCTSGHCSTQSGRVSQSQDRIQYRQG